MKTTTPLVRNPISRSSVQGAFLLIPLLLTCFVLLPTMQALVPPPDGGYPGGNTAEGDGALNSITPRARGSGANNTALGYHTLFKDTAGSDNTAVGYNALTSNIAGSFNTATGSGALAYSAGSYNTANGYQALFSPVGGGYNTAVGSQAAFSMALGLNNTAVGYQALFSNAGDSIFFLLGSQNTAIGSQTLYSNVEGNANTAVGYQSLYSDFGTNFSGSLNTGIGRHALFSNTSGNGNIAVGDSAGSELTTGNYNIDIANVGVGGESNTIRIGTPGTHMKIFIAGISGANEGNPTAVFINTTTGQLGTTPPASSRQYKKDIKPMNKVSETILAFKPVIFQYKSDDKGTPQFGLIAEEVAQANPDLVIYDPEGKPYTVRYDAVNAMLLNEFLKEHKKVEDLETTVTQQQKRFGQQEDQIQALTSGLQRISAQLEVNKPAPQIVANTH
jgi:hypothetical protein